MVAQFDGKVALVTGAGSGIGQASALAFAREGARVVVADIDDTGGAETVDQIRQAGGQAHFVRTDVAQQGDVKALIDATVDTYGRLDFAHNNAGIAGMAGRPVPLHEYPEEVWDRVIATNLTGVYLCMKYEIRQMLRAGGGAIVNTASTAGLRGAPFGAYTAAKHGVVGLTRLAVEYAPLGIRVNAVCPAFVHTPMVQTAIIDAADDPAQAEALLAAAQPIGRMGTPEEVAAAIVWLCSDAASFITGVLLPTDGGMMAR
jgi:NAD(P)-dependent dehydrogenase (short-subunit alcohol dehydrogenase family)